MRREYWFIILKIAEVFGVLLLLFVSHAIGDTILSLENTDIYSRGLGRTVNNIILGFCALGIAAAIIYAVGYLIYLWVKKNWEWAKELEEEDRNE